MNTDFEYKKVNVVLGFGNTVHIAIYDNKNQFCGVICGAHYTNSQQHRMATVNKTDYPVTCKRCLKKAK